MNHLTSFGALAIGIIVVGGAIAAQPAPVPAAQPVDSARALG